MEYLEGQSLNRVIKRARKQGERSRLRRLRAHRRRRARRACTTRTSSATTTARRSASSTATSRPHNVFVTYDGQVKLVDFGIAKAALSSVETEAGVLKGKVAYMAPEQASGGPIDRRADIFAMGIVLWELLAQERLMGGDSAAATLHRLISQPIPRVSALRPDIDPELDAIVARALEKKADDRFQSAIQMRDALEAYIARSGRIILSDEIGRQINGMFQDVRAEIQRQIQLHMEGVTEVPFPSGETDALATIHRRTCCHP